MDENLQYAVRDQLERIADSLESIDNNNERMADSLGSIDQTIDWAINILVASSSEQTEFEKTETGSSEVALQPSDQQPAPQHLALFLESLPTWLYNELRRKIIPTHLAARLIGMPQNQLQKLTELGMVKSKSGRYDLVELLGYLEDTLGDYDDHNSKSEVTVHTRQ